MSTTSSISDDDGSYYSNPKRPSSRPWMGLCLVNCLRALRRPRTRSLCFFIIVSIPAILGISFYLDLLPGPQWLPSLSSSPTNDIGILGNSSGSNNEESSSGSSSSQSNGGNGNDDGNGAVPTGGNGGGSNGGSNNNNLQNMVGPNRPKSFDIASCGETSFLESSESTNNSSSSSNTTLDDNKDSFEYFCSGVEIETVVNEKVGPSMILRCIIRLEVFDRFLMSARN